MSKTEQTEAPAEDAENIPVQNRVEAGMEGADGDDASSGLQADLDRFRDLALAARPTSITTKSARPARRKTRLNTRTAHSSSG
jgi:hypothetical protein